MKTFTIERRASTAAEPTEVFRLLTHGSEWPEWSPIDKAEIDSDDPDGPDPVGTIRTFTTGRTTSKEQVIASEPATRFSYILLEGMPLRDYRAEVTLDETAAGTDIRWRSTFQAKIPFTGALYRRGIDKFIGVFLDSLVDTAERSARA